MIAANANNSSHDTEIVSDLLSLEGEVLNQLVRRIVVSLDRADYQMVQLVNDDGNGRVRIQFLQARDDSQKNAADFEETA